MSANPISLALQGKRNPRSAPGTGTTTASATRGAIWWLGIILIISLRWSAAGGPPSQAGALGHHSSRILVLPASPEAATQLNQLHANLGRQVQRVYADLGQLQLVHLAAGERVEAAIHSIQQSGLVTLAEPDFVVSAAAVLPDDPRFQDGTQWWLHNYGQSGGLPDADIDAPEAWDILTSAQAVIVAIIDSGVRYTHEDLASNLWRNPVDQSFGYDALTDGHDPWDENGHGTHLAGIVGAVGNNAKGISGIAWNVKIMACNFLDAAGNGYISDAIKCIEFARTHAARVLNLSWGGPEASLALSNALWFARADGISVVAAAGNLAANLDVTPYYPASFGLDHVVTVGASTRNETLYSLSSYGAQAVDLFAPGAAMFSSSSIGDSAYATRHGTSMAAACVAGGLALVQTRFPAATPQELRRRLLHSVDPAIAYAGKCVSGGRFNLRKALDLPRLSVDEVIRPVRIRLTGVAHHEYVLSGSSDFASWLPLRTNRTASGEWEYIDSESTNLPHRFYRGTPGP